MSRILLGVSGGIAAYKTLLFIRLATEAGHSVRVVQSPASRRFVGEASFAALTGAPVLSDEFELDPARGAFPDQQPPTHQPLSHLELVANADIYLIAPASANTLAKLAHGLADNLLTSCALAATCPVVVAPAMNSRMYEHPATRANLDLLRARGLSVVDPDVGRLASVGEEGVGRLAEPQRLLDVCEQTLGNSDTHPDDSSLGPATAGPASADLQGVHVLVTAGGTREPIDSVRFLGNSSSGRMGVALASAAHRRGADVTLIAANMAVEPPAGVAVLRVETAAELRDVCEREFPSCEILLMAAAVADFRPTDPADGKIKKRGRERLTIELEPTVDVIGTLSSQRCPEQTLVAFAAEHGPGAVDHGRQELSSKGVDAVVVNDISRVDIGFDSEDNEVTIVTSDGEQHIPKSSKRAIAESILDAVQALRTQA